MATTHEIKRWMVALIQSNISDINQCEIATGAIPKDQIPGLRYPFAMVIETGSLTKGINNKKLFETSIDIVLIVMNQQDIFGESASHNLSQILVQVQNEIVKANSMQTVAVKNLNIDAGAAAVDKGGNKIGIPITAHTFEAGEIVIIEDSTKYSVGSRINSGCYLIVSETANEIVVYPALYSAENFLASATVHTIEKVFMKNMSIGKIELLDVTEFRNSLIGQTLSCKVWHEIS